LHLLDAPRPPDPCPPITHVDALACRPTVATWPSCAVCKPITWPAPVRKRTNIVVMPPGQAVLSVSSYARNAKALTLDVRRSGFWASVWQLCCRRRPSEALLPTPHGWLRLAVAVHDGIRAEPIAVARPCIHEIVLPTGRKRSPQRLGQGQALHRPMPPTIRHGIRIA
jgi:hypothetical protein